MFQEEFSSPAGESVNTFFSPEEEFIFSETERLSVASLFVETDLVVASSVASIDSQEWRKLGARRTHEALDGITGIVNYPALGGSNIVSIRGFTNTSSVRGVVWMLDGVPLNALSFGTSAYTVPNWELGTLDKMEIIKGPGSAIYGSDAFHGVISMQSFEAEEDYYYAEASGAYPGYGDSSVKISQGFADDVLRVDATAAISHQDDLDITYEYEDIDIPLLYSWLGWRNTNGTGVRPYRYDSLAGTVKCRLQPSPWLKIGMAGYGSKWTAEGHAGERILAFAIHAREKDLVDNESKFLMGKAFINLSLPGDISFELDVHSWAVDREYLFYIPQELLNITSNLPFLSFASVSRGIRSIDEQRTGTTVTIKQPNNAFNLQWLIGYSYSNLKVTDVESLIELYPSGRWVESSFETGQGFDGLERDINSGFFQLKWQVIIDNLFLLLGGRADDYSDFGLQLTPRAGMIYLPDSRTAIKALYGRAFRAPSANELSSSGPQTRSDPNLKAEIIDVYELIYMKKKQNLKYSVSGFYSAWQDGIVAVPNPDFVPFAPEGSLESFTQLYTNEGKNRAYGAEATLAYTYTAFTLDLGLAYTMSEAVDVQDPLNKDNLSDKRYDVFPEFALRLGLGMELEALDLSLYLNNRILVGMKEYPSILATENRSPETMSPYWRADLTVCKEFGDRGSLMLIIRNLQVSKNSMPSVSGMKGGLEEPGTSLMIRAAYQF